MVEDGYERLGNFKARVIDVAVSQINEHSDLAVRYEQRKTGRTVSHFKFVFEPKEKPPQPAQAEEEVPQDSPLFRRLRGHGIGAKLAAGWVGQDPARVFAALEYVEAKARLGEVRGRTAGYLRTVFEAGADIPGPEEVVSPPVPERRIGGVPVSEIEKRAHPGETYPQAAARLKRQRAAGK